MSKRKRAKAESKRRRKDRLDQKNWPAASGASRIPMKNATGTLNWEACERCKLRTGNEESGYCMLGDKSSDYIEINGSEVACGAFTDEDDI